MYKSIRIKKVSIAINKFRKAAKNPPFNESYMTGFYKHTSHDSVSYFFIIHTLRIIISIHRNIGACQG